MPRTKKLKLNNRQLILIGTVLVIVSFLLGNFSQSVLSQTDLFSKIKVKPPVTADKKETGPDLVKLQEEVIPQKGYVFKIKWGDLGRKLIEDGVIDESKLAKALTGQDKLPPEYKKYLDDSGPKQIELNNDNSRFWVDVLWGLGLANKNALLEKGPMVEGGKTANFASTGGYTLGVGEPMSYYNQFEYISLTLDQQERVEKIAGGIYRPCCGNSAAFPDCNHGMAALALVELMVSQNFSDNDIYKTVLAFNAYWFPNTYLDISYHFAKNGREYKDIPASELLSKTFSSSQGYAAIKRQVGTVDWPALKRSGGGCGA